MGRFDGHSGRRKRNDKRTANQNRKRKKKQRRKRNGH
jgi:hypothetical protein